jgi:hypothetical protein
MASPPRCCATCGGLGVARYRTCAACRQRRVEAERLSQGLGRFVTEPGTLSTVAAILTRAPSPEGRREAS